MRIPEYVDLLPWLLTALALGLAVVFGVLWHKARIAIAEAQAKTLRAEQALQAAHDEARRTARQLHTLSLAETDAAILLNPDRTVLSLNPTAQALFGDKAAPGQTLIVATRSGELDELAAHVAGGGEDRDRQVTINGQPFRARMAITEDGHLALVLKDLGELQRLGRARRDFIANISHELRTPLTSIRLLLESLLSGVAHTPQDANALLLKINTEVQALEQMAQELLDLAQIESGQIVIRLVPAPVSRIVRRSVERLQPLAERKQQTIRTEVPAELTALVDLDQINRVLGNLLHNAIKFTPPGGTISVRASQMQDDILIEVSDTGPGIQPQDLPRVFERFFRGDRSRKSGGTGLGLAVAKHVVEAHGGKIWAENKPGQGAAFCFTLVPGEERKETVS
jgi:two-component system phosphate regulon sensor histidine kinase PhoR